MTFRGDHPLVRALVVVALFEMVVLRIFTRVAVHIPNLERVAGVSRGLAAAGRYSYFVAVVLLISALVLLAVRMPRVRPAVATFLVAAGGVRLGLVSDDLVAVVVGACVVVLALDAGRSLGTGGRVVAGAFAAAFAVSVVQMVTPVDRMLHYLAEALAVAAAIAALGLGGRPRDRRAVIAGAATAVLVWGALAANAATTKILSLWTFGLAGYLPAPAEAAAAGAIVFAVTDTVRRGRGAVGLPLALIAIGGLGLHSTYQSGLVVVGLALLAVAHDRDPSFPAVAGAPAADRALELV